MKNIMKIFLSIALFALVLISCTEEEDLSYKGPSLIEFKNYYLEIQTRLGLATFESAYPFILPADNQTLKAITAKQPSVLRTGTITIAGASPTVVTGTGTQFATDLAVGSIVKDSRGTILGYVSSIASNTSLTLTANSTAFVTGAFYRASLVPQGRITFSDSVLVQLVGRQRTADLTVSYIVDENPEGTVPAVEGVHFDFVRNPEGQILIKGNSSAGYIYINVYDALGAAGPNKLTLTLTLQNAGDVEPSENYKTFTYNITK